MPDIKRVRNWKEYNTSLKNRGSIIFRFTDTYLKNLYYLGKQCRGGIKQYTNQMFELILNIKVLFRLPWRAAIGFTEGLLKKLLPNHIIKVPDFAHASRAASKLHLKVKQYNLSPGDMEIAFDSTGISVYSTSGWHQRKYGKNNKYNQKDQWKKVHVGIDLNSKQVLVSGFTASNVNDCEAFNDMSNDLRGNIASVRADAAYDTYKIYKQIHQWGAKAIIPPGNRAKAQDELKQKVKIKDYLEQRDKVIHSIRKHNNFEEGLQEWKKESQYHKRSLIEAFMYRFKSIFGFSLHNRSERGRRNEIKAKLTLLNLMTSLGMAEYF